MYPTFGPARSVDPRDDHQEATNLPDKLATYSISGFLGHSGVGLVYQVTDPNFDRQLALKVLPHRHAADPAAVRHFLDEAFICGQLQHPGIAPVHHCGQLEDGRPFFTMDIVEGYSLAQLLRERRDPRSKRRKLLSVLEKVCQTIAYAHAEGVVHGNIDPGNIIVGAFGEVQIVDWSSAHLIDAERAWVLPRPELGSAVDRERSTTSTQARDGEAPPDARIDAFRLGGILDEILTGQPFDPGATRTGTPIGSTTARPTCTDGSFIDYPDDRALAELATRCLSADPADRPWSASEVEAAVTDYLESIEERTLQSRIQADQALAKERRRHRRIVVALAAITMLALIIAAGTIL